MSKSYPILNEITKSNKFQISLGLLVFFLLWILQPFELDEIPKFRMLIIFGYGVITYVLLFIHFKIIPSLFPKFFIEDNWTLLKEIIFILWIVFWVGNLNYLYTGFWTLYVDAMPLNLKWYLIMQSYTFRLSFFPVIIITLLKQIIFVRKYLKYAERINRNLPIRANPKSDNSQSILLHSENKKLRLSVNLSELLYIVSRENYAEIVLFNKKLDRHLIRNSLKNIESSFINHQQIYRCHRSYLVNVQKTNAVVGNSQGLKLIIEHSNEKIPVSRSRIKQFQGQVISA